MNTSKQIFAYDNYHELASYPLFPTVLFINLRMHRFDNHSDDRKISI